jgi:hypothetical protein
VSSEDSLRVPHFLLSTYELLAAGHVRIGLKKVVVGDL